MRLLAEVGRHPAISRLARVLPHAAVALGRTADGVDVALAALGLLQAEDVPAGPAPANPGSRCAARRAFRSRSRCISSACRSPEPRLWYEPPKIPSARRRFNYASPSWIRSKTSRTSGGISSREWYTFSRPRSIAIDEALALQFLGRDSRLCLTQHPLHLRPQVSRHLVERVVFFSNLGFLHEGRARRELGLLGDPGAKPAPFDGGIDNDRAIRPCPTQPAEFRHHGLHARRQGRLSMGPARLPVGDNLGQDRQLARRTGKGGRRQIGRASASLDAPCARGARA
jgi:hypothetical protein